MHRLPRLTIVLGLLGALAMFAQAQGVATEFPNYGEGSLGLAATPGTQGGAAAGFWNPAAWSAMDKWEMSLLWNDRDVHPKRMDNWGFALGGNGIGFAMRRNNFTYGGLMAPGGLNYGHVDDYQIAVGGGDGGDYWGLSWNWSKGRTAEYARGRGELERDDYLALGNITRPTPCLSIGNTETIGLHHGHYRGITDVGMRPLKNHRLTLFGDAAYGEKDSWSTLQWGAGMEVQPINGLRVAGKMSKLDPYSQEKTYSLSLGLSLGGTGLQVIPHYDKDQNRLSTSYLLRMGEQQPTVKTPRFFGKKNDVVTMKLKGQVVYQSARLMDKERFALKDMLDRIDAAKQDPTVGGIALNVSDFYGSPATLWEIRQKLEDFKRADKKVYVYIDRGGMNGYAFATVADYLWMDPQGQLALPGYAMGRTYWRGFFDKIGIGVDEWRFFTYKSAFESFSRKNMSEADREQRLALVTDFYNEWQRNVTGARKLSAETLRALVDSLVIFTAQDALAAGLVDTLGRWPDAKDIIKKVTGQKPNLIRSGEVTDVTEADQQWGKLPTVALVYAIGACDMDSGIKGRQTSAYMSKLEKRKDVKAVVLRVDSPGGDALPSDLIAEQMTKIKAKKPMIVSQGMYAASGGYWLSMNADKIYSTPPTITGSIGVIGGWLWNEKITDKTGFTWDHVQIGKHAELGGGIVLPFVGLQIPDRNLNTEERARMEKLIRGMYTDFTQQVAAGRKLDVAFVDSVGQGRAWTGRRALDLKLVDELGTLDDAIDYARAQAKIPAHRRIKIEEYPKRPLFDFSQFMPQMSPFGLRWSGRKGSGTAVSAQQDYELHYWQRMAGHRGLPLLMMDPADMPSEELVPSGSLGN